ncbi:hypothetical protein I4F81_008287 [Pyropia yezoensis]|uniref:Uncharacterized protein n=1 Tax=Pyropia yezoensis TaxID=2788 RepID=A0ACC3C732_PYRYE|nr:hypothetical protein I4F81_008287 [Neopyropia yezoensis]
MGPRAVAAGAPAALLLLAAALLAATAAAPTPARGGFVGVLFPSLPACNLPRPFLVNISAADSANTPAGLGYMEDSSARGTDNNAADRAAAGLTYLGQLSAGCRRRRSCGRRAGPGTPPHSPCSPLPPRPGGQGRCGGGHRGGPAVAPPPLGSPALAHGTRWWQTRQARTDRG